MHPDDAAFLARVVALRAEPEDSNAILDAIYDVGPATKMELLAFLTITLTARNKLPARAAFGQRVLAEYTARSLPNIPSFLEGLLP